MSFKASANVKIGKMSLNKILNTYEMAKQTVNIARKYRMAEQSESNIKYLNTCEMAEQTVKV
jgi:hypothetical protein